MQRADRFARAHRETGLDRRGHGRRRRPRAGIRRSPPRQTSMCPDRTRIRAATGARPILRAACRALRPRAAARDRAGRCRDALGAGACRRVHSARGMRDEHRQSDASGFLATYGTALAARDPVLHLRRRRAELPQSDESAERAEAGQLSRDPRARLRPGAHHRRARPLVRQRLQLRRGASSAA